jgi:hypothetical protein
MLLSSKTYRKRLFMGHQLNSHMFKPVRMLTALAESHPQRALSQLRLLKQNTTDWVAYKQEKFISHSSEDWEA